MPTQPQDHLPKLARTTSTVMILDSTKADDYDAALNALDGKEQELLTSLPRRVAGARAKVSAGAPEEVVAAAMDQVREVDETVLQPLREALAAAEVVLDAVRQAWVFKSLGNVRWKRTRKDHPAGDEDQAEWDANGGTGKAPYAFEGIARDVLKTATVTPSVTPEFVDDMFDGDAWSSAELEQLWTTALAAQITARPDPKRRR